MAQNALIVNKKELEESISAAFFKNSTFYIIYMYYIFILYLYVYIIHIIYSILHIIYHII